MPHYSVYVRYGVSQVIDVEADDAEAAVAVAVGQCEHPNASNRFDMEGDPEGAIIATDGVHISGELEFL